MLIYDKIQLIVYITFNNKGRAPDMVKGYYGVQWHSRDAKNGSYDKYYGQKNPRLSNEFNLENTIVTKGNYNPWNRQAI